MATKHAKRNVKKNVKTHKRHKYKRHYRKRQFKNSLREYLVADNPESEHKYDVVVVPESGNIIHGLRDMLSTKN
jgi:hypothetical protein